MRRGELKYTSIRLSIHLAEGQPKVNCCSVKQVFRFVFVFYEKNILLFEISWKQHQHQHQPTCRQAVCHRHRCRKKLLTLQIVNK